MNSRSLQIVKLALKQDEHHDGDTAASAPDLTDLSDLSSGIKLHSHMLHMYVHTTN